MSYFTFGKTKQNGLTVRPFSEGIQLILQMHSKQYYIYERLTIMRYEYKSEASAIITFNARETPGLPGNIGLEFSTVHVRLYNSEDQPGFFSGALAIPAHKDDEGYVLELSFNDSLKILDKEYEETPSFDYDFDTGEPSGFYYEAPLNDHDFNSITGAASCHFREKVEDGRHLLLFNLKIDGTPFLGHTLIDEELYHIKGKE